MNLYPVVSIYIVWQITLLVCSASLWILRAPQNASRRLWYARIIFAASCLVPIVAVTCPNLISFDQPEALRLVAKTGAIESLTRISTEIRDSPILNSETLKYKSSPQPSQTGFFANVTLVCVALVACWKWFLYIKERQRLLTIVYKAKLQRSFRCVEIRTSNELDSPLSLVIHGRRFVILTEESEVSARERQIVIAHEFQHHRQFDPIIAHFNSIVLALAWVNPCTWPIQRWFRDLEEFACDERVLCDRNISPREYGECLLHIARNVIARDKQRDTPLSYEAAQFFSGSRFNARIRYLSSHSKPKSSLTATVTFALTGTVLVITSLSSVARGSHNKTTSSLPQEEDEAMLLARASDSWRLSGTAPNSYEFETDFETRFSGDASGVLRSKGETTEGNGTISQTISAENYLGTRVRLKAVVKSEDVRDWAGVWMRIDLKDRYTVTFDDMSDRPIVGSRDWQKYAIVLDVPNNAQSISFGVLLNDAGTVWVDNMELEVVDKSVPLTSYKQPKRPANLGFEHFILRK